MVHDIDLADTGDDAVTAHEQWAWLHRQVAARRVLAARAPHRPYTPLQRSWLLAAASAQLNYIAVHETDTGDDGVRTDIPYPMPLTDTDEQVPMMIIGDVDIDPLFAAVFPWSTNSIPKTVAKLADRSRPPLGERGIAVVDDAGVGIYTITDGNNRLTRAIIEGRATVAVGTLYTRPVTMIDPAAVIIRQNQHGRWTAVTDAGNELRQVPSQLQIDEPTRRWYAANGASIQPFPLPE